MERDFIVTFNEDLKEARNLLWTLLPSPLEKLEGFESLRDLYSGSQSHIYNHRWIEMIVQDGESLSISSGLHLL